MEGAGWLNLYLAHCLTAFVAELCSELVEWVANRVTLEQVVVETGCEGLERVDRVVEARLEWWRVEVHFVLSGIEVVEVEVAKGLV